MNVTSRVTQRKRSRLDYVILITALLLIAANQVFETTSLRASGTIEITEGSAIPQDANYTITSSSLPSVMSAIILNESIDDNQISFDIPIQNVTRILCNVTLKSDVINSTSRLDFYISGYHKTIDVSTGPTPTTYSFEPNVDDINYSEYWIRTCYIGTRDERISLHEIVIWAEFEVPVSAVVLDWRTTDGQALFDNKYIRQMDDFEPIIRMKSYTYVYNVAFNPTFQNRTLYLTPQTYTFEPSWFYRGPDSFNITVVENMTSTCLIHTRAVRLYLSVEPVLPLVRLTISPYSDYYSDFAYQLLLQGTEIPEYIYVPLFPSYYIEVTTNKLLSYNLGDSPDVVVRGSVQSNGTYDLRINTIMPYMNVLSLQITPHDFVQISLAMVLFALVVLRIFLYLNRKRPRTSWKDPRLIPILLIGVTVFLPWFSALRDYFPYDDIPLDVHVSSLGVIPLVIAWTDSGGIFLALPPNGILWAVVSLLFFWVPLLCANYAMTPPSVFQENCFASLLMLSPIIYLGNVHVGLHELYSFPFIVNSTIQFILIFFPLIFISILILLRMVGEYGYGHFRNQLSFDVTLAEQLIVEKDPIEVTDSPKAFVEKEPVPSLNERELQRALNLVLVILQFLFLLIPSTLGFVLERTYPTNEYVLEYVYLGTPINSIGVLFESMFDYRVFFGFLMFLIPVYYIFTFGIVGEFVMNSRKLLSFTLFVFWAVTPVILFISASSIHFYYSGVEWILISLPYYLLTFVSVMKIGSYIKEEINLRSLLVWIIIPLLLLIPSGLILSWIGIIQEVMLAWHVFNWVPLPLASFVLIFITWPLHHWYQNKKQSLQVDIEMDDILHSDNVVGDLG
ncbi:MAG: hypothetical protein ACW98U_16035 [Candidatus Thorarchaeota archaeon]|jgi:hypothetical protein